jgi:hypothetical protein
MPMSYFSGWISTQKKFQVEGFLNDLFFWGDIHPESKVIGIQIDLKIFLGG